MKVFLTSLLCCFLGSAFASGSDRMPNDSTDYYTSFDGTRIHYTVKGEGTPVLLVHGFIVNGESWKQTAIYDSLLNNGFQVITLDLRGNGISDHPHDSLAYLNDAEAKDIMGLVSYLKLPSYRVVGYSRGSIIVARLLVLDTRIKSAVMGGMGTAFTNPQWPRRIMFYNALSGQQVPELSEMVNYVRKSGLDQRALAMMQFAQPSTSPEELGKVNKPVLVLGGDKDPDNDTGGSLAAMMPAGMHGTVPGDHNGVVKSKDFASWTLHFLTEH
jgi:pimeloyl-ACP methyl ester carboxylesterase